MTDIKSRLAEAFSAAIVAAFGPENSTDPQLKWAANAAFGDLQANFAMGLGKRLGKPPRAVAEAVVAKLDLKGIEAKTEIAGPGFVNVSLSDSCIAGLVSELAADPRCGAVAAAKPRRVAIDYSAPNVAKEMHVGHIRSTIIGDALARVLSFLGHEVLRRNHLGDWGTQFGMLVEHVSALGWKPGQPHDIRDLNALYKEAKARFDAEPDFAEKSRLRVVSLQAGDEVTVALWRELVQESKHHFAEVYATLGVLLGEEDYYGESYYNPMLAPTTEELLASGIAVESEGAVCVFPPGFKGQDGEPVPLIVRKKDGGYGYDTTDLAAFRHRVRDLKADRLVYVTDSRQKQHFAMIFEAARMAGWLSGDTVAEHVPFGMVLGDDGKPFKTRSGETIRLQDLLSEAVERAYAVVNAKSAELSEAEKRTVARTVGIGAIKYADLSNDRIKDYVFSWERMLAFDGNTAPYLLNAYVRIMAIFRKAAEAGLPVSKEAAAAKAPEERALAIQVLKFDDAVDQVAKSLEPHRLCTYLYDLASAFHHFYESCPVLAAPDEATKRSRLGLCAIVAEAIKLGLGLLGIGTIDRM
jgi:arginyl-tRNA synthetase